jgi:hypothetical protein
MNEVGAMETIDARDAVKSATDYLDQIKDLMGETFNNLRLEELELSENLQRWMVTLGYDVPYTPSGIESLMTPGNYGQKSSKREYKIFNVNAQTGAVQSMKIRSI